MLLSAGDWTSYTSQELSNPNDVRVYSIYLGAGEVVQASVDTSRYAGGLDSYLRILQNNAELASNDNDIGLDPGLTFHAPQAGTYEVEVSSSLNATGGGKGEAQGQFDLTLRRSQPLEINSQTEAIELASRAQDYYRIELLQAGQLRAHVSATDPVSMTLYDSRGTSIVQSNGASRDDLGPLIVQGMTPGIYYLKVENLGDATTLYEVTTQLTPSDSVLQTVPMEEAPRLVVQGDFNGDGLLDLATGAQNITILLGNGDGTFQKMEPIRVNNSPEALVAGDFNGDGWADLAFSNSFARDVTILYGNGDGTFIRHSVPGANGNTLAAADFDGDGTLDLAVGNTAKNPAQNVTPKVVFLFNAGNGVFNISQPLDTSPAALLAGDFNADGHPDLVVAELAPDKFNKYHVSLWVNEGDGSFAGPVSFVVGQRPVALAAGDFNGDEKLDLAVANLVSQDVTVLWGDDSAHFRDGGTTPIGRNPEALVTGDFNGDDLLDLATANAFAGDLTVLLGDGNGDFQNVGSVTAGARPLSLSAGDFDGDGNLDLASANYYAANVTVLLGHGDGTFPQSGSPNATGFHPQAMVQGDFNGDGRPDLATANYDFGTVSILLGLGDGAFQAAGTFSTAGSPIALAVGDFNGDGRLDLATANLGANNVTILLGQGNGSFLPGGAFAVGGRPSAIVSGDFDRDGDLDLAISTEYDADGNFDNKIVLLAGDGHGSFGNLQTFTVGLMPTALVTGDFNGDDWLDLAVAQYYSRDVVVLLGHAAGAQDVFAFEQSDPYPLLGPALCLVAGDFDGDRHLDLAVGNLYYSEGQSLTVLWNDTTGRFDAESRPSSIYSLPAGIKTLVGGDFNGDGRLDLIAGNLGQPSITVILGTSTGFDVHEPMTVASDPHGLAVADFNGDGRLDLAAAGFQSANVTVLLGEGAGGFASPRLAPGPVQSTPLLKPLTGQQNDAIVLTQNGQILFRRGLADQPGAFAPPTVLNTDPKQAARALTLVQTANDGWLLAALGANGFAVTLYQPHPDGTFTTLPGPAFPLGAMPANIASADLTGDGLDDLVITAAGSGQVFVSIQTGDGAFAAVQAYTVGKNPSAIELIDVNADHRTDIVVTDRFSGQAFVLLNQAGGLFDPEAERFRAGTGLYGLTLVNGAATVQSLEGTNGVAAGSFDDRPGNDLVVINGGTLNFTLLSGDGTTGFLNPQVATTVLTAGAPTAIVTGDFDRDGNLDLAVLAKETGKISIYRGSGLGSFVRTAILDGGNLPTGLTLADATRPAGGAPDGFQDLLIGNIYGDLLILAGNGDGTFSQYRRADQKVSLAVAHGPGNGQNIFYFSDQGSDRLAYKAAAGGTSVVVGPTVYQDRSAGIQAPGDQKIVTVLGVQYLLILNSGANELLIYTIGPDGLPSAASKQAYYTGTNPVGLTVTSPANDLNGDAIPDVAVANEGSNDVSIFLGQMSNQGWGLSYRPRQSSGGMGPTSVAVASATAADGVGTPNSIPNLMISNGQSNNVAVLTNRGEGFFINQPATGEPSFRTGINPQVVLVGNFDKTPGLDLVTLNAGSNDVTLIANFLTPRAVSFTYSSGGIRPETAVVAEINGTTFLLVANVGNGTLEMLAGTAEGLEVSGIFSPAAIPNLSDIALVATSNGFDVYGTIAGREVAVLLGTFGVDVLPPAPLPPGPGFPGGVVIVFNEVPFSDTNIEPTFVMALLATRAPSRFGATEDETLDSGSYADTTVMAEASATALDEDVSTGANRSRILWRNITEPTLSEKSDPIDFQKEQEQDGDVTEWLLGTDPFEVVPTAYPKKTGGLRAAPEYVAIGAELDLTVPPISLQSPANETLRMVIDLQPRSSICERSAEIGEPDHAPIAKPIVAHKVSSTLAFCCMAPLVMAHLLENLRPNWTKTRNLLSKVWR